MAREGFQRFDTKTTRGFSALAWLALIFAVVIVGSALWLSLRATDRTAVPKVIAKDQWFPEPSFLLNHARDLNLTIGQIRSVESADRNWQLRKAGYESRLKTLNSSADAALRDLQNGSDLKGTYGEIVKEFDVARQRAWENAILNLDKQQVSRIEKIRKPDDKRQSSRVPSKRKVRLESFWIVHPVLVDLDQKIFAVKADLATISAKLGAHSHPAKQYKQKLHELQSYRRRLPQRLEGKPLPDPQMWAHRLVPFRTHDGVPSSRTRWPLALTAKA